MQATFVHTADNHLGYEQYGVKERFNDFARAFLSIVDDAIARRADLFVVAGDLFNKRAIDALTLIQAQTALQKLKDAGIPAVAIEGNHDRSYYRDGISWLQFLCWQGLLTLLNPLVRDGVPELTAWDSEAMRGAYLDLLGGRLRVYGLPWYGASTARIMEGFAHELAAAHAEEETAGVEYRLLVMHTGVEGMVPNMHGLPTRAQFEPLRGLVDYVALGHVHKPYEIDGWLYNPGSTETWGAEESEWERGYYVTHIDTGVVPGLPRHMAEHIINPRRPFVRLLFKVDGLPDPDALYQHFERYCKAEARGRGFTGSSATDLQPVVDIALTGVLAFDASAWERGRIERIVQESFSALVVRLRDGTRDTDFDPEADDAVDGRDRSTWHQLELSVFQDLMARDARYAPNAARWAQVLAEMKQLALGNEEPAIVAERLRAARLQLLS
jgi:DNA repair exonuclease SbcCD nuclease subunit